MSKNYENEIKQMQRLIDYGTKKNEVNENRNNNSVVEYQTKGADGRTYGIVRECSKYYIKVAPQKDTAIVTEDFDYIGGFNNKRFNEYSTYTMASKQLDLKLKAINEAVGSNMPTSQFVETPSAEWQINETKEMRAELNRFHELVNNVDKLLQENNHMTTNHTIPEAPGKAKVTDNKVKSPWEDSAAANGDKELSNKKADYSKAGPFETNPKVDMQSDKKPQTPGDNGIPFNEKPLFGPGHKLKAEDAVAKQKPSGGKVTRADESVGRTIKLTEEQVLAWSRNKDYMDKSHGTEIGHNGDPFEEEVNPEKENDRNINTEYKMNEEVAAHITDNQNKPKPGTGEPKDYEDPFEFEVEVNEDVTDTTGDDQRMLLDDERPFGEFDDEDFDEFDDDDFEGDEFGDDEDLAELPDEDVIDDEEVNFNDDDRDAKFFKHNDVKDFEDRTEIPDDESFVNDDDFYNDEGLRGLNLDDNLNGLDDDFDDNYPDFSESRSRRRNRRMNENLVLNDFGKHPAYQKEVMSLPPNKEIDRWGRDWNDDSTKGDEPYGRKIGSSAPYTEDIIDKITDMVINRLSAGKKKI